MLQINTALSHQAGSSIRVNFSEVSILFVHLLHFYPPILSNIVPLLLRSVSAALARPPPEAPGGTPSDDLERVGPLLFGSGFTLSLFLLAFSAFLRRGSRFLSSSSSN